VSSAPGIAAGFGFRSLGPLDIELGVAEEVALAVKACSASVKVRGGEVSLTWQLTDGAGTTANGAGTTADGAGTAFDGRAVSLTAFKGRQLQYAVVIPAGYSATLVVPPALGGQALTDVIHAGSGSSSSSSSSSSGSNSRPHSSSSRMNMVGQRGDKEHGALQFRLEAGTHTLHASYGDAGAV
jgi:hypothetical protein